VDLLSQSAALVAVTAFAFGVSVLARNTRNTLYLWFFGLMLAVSAWAMTFLIAHLGPDALARDLHLIINAWLGTLALLFLRDFLQDGRSSRALLRVSLGLSISGTLAVALGLHDRIEAIRIAVLFAPGTLVIQILLLWARDGFGGFLERRGSFRRPLIYIGAIAVMATAVLDHAPILGPVIPVVGNIGLILYLFLLAQAITQQTAFNLGFYVARLIVVLVFAAILTGLHTTLLPKDGASPETFWLNSFVVSFFFVALIDPIRQMMGFVTHRVSARAYLDLNRRLERWTESVRAAESLESTLKESVRGLLRLLAARRVDAFCPTRDGIWLKREAIQGPSVATDERAPRVREMTASDPVITALEKLRLKNKFPVLIEASLAIEQERAVAKADREELIVIRERLRDLGADVVIGVCDHDTLVGILISDVPFPPIRFGGSWVFLEKMAPSLTRMAQAWTRHLDFDRKREIARLDELGELSAGLAHEIRNPLGSIKGAIQLIEGRQSLEAGDRQLLEIASTEVDRLNRVVTQFLSYAKAPQVRLEQVELVSALRQWFAGESTNPLYKEIRFEFSTDLEEIAVLGHRDSIFQVIANFTRNAAQSLRQSPVSVPSILLVITRRELGAPVYIRVQDNGAGIVSEVQSKLFVPFFTTRSGSGTGLGLSISERLARNMGARIEFSSQPGVRTQFDLVFQTGVGSSKK
jgi:two-component system sensor histidine kinase HydH